MKNKNDYFEQSQEEHEIRWLKLKTIKIKNNHRNVRRSAGLAVRSSKPTAKAAELVSIPEFDVFEDSIHDVESELRAAYDTSTKEYKYRYDHNGKEWKYVTNHA